MQIFATSSCPKQCAEWLDDKRLNKMVTESAQMICTIAHSDGKKNLPFKPTHAHHPLVKWADSDNRNLWWLQRHHYALSGEWTHRMGKIHASTLHEMYLPGIPTQKEPETFRNCAANDMRGLDFRWCDDVHLAYRMYLYARWLKDTRKPKWSKRNEPNWRMDVGDLYYRILCERAMSLVNTKQPQGEIPCPRCGEELQWKTEHKKIVSLQCTTSDCIFLKPL